MVVSRPGKRKAKGRSGEVKKPKRKFKATMNTGAVAMHGDVQMALNDKSVQVVDARSRAASPARIPSRVRDGVRPYAGRVQCALYRNRRERPPLCRRSGSPRPLKKAASIPDKPVITSCGSGVTAAILTLGLDALGKKPAAFMTAPGGMGLTARFDRRED